MSRLVHAYFGEGKGKTTAAVGLAVRMAGAGGKVLFFQFLKDNTSSERRILEKEENITLLCGMERVMFIRNMTETEKDAAKRFYQSRLQEISRIAGAFDMVVLDEFLTAVDKGVIDCEAAKGFLQERPKETELVLTGRTQNRTLLQFCDYVTEMKKIKHPYDRAVQARKGIEF